MRIRTFALAGAVTATMSLMGLALSTATATTAAAATEKPRSCVMNVVTGTTACYGNFTTALAAATGGKITDAPNDASTAANDPKLAARLNASASKKDSSAMANRAAADIVIGIEYEDDSYEDSSLIYSAGGGCTLTTADVDWLAASLPSGWNDEIGSYRTYGGCWAKHFWDINFGGSWLGFDAGRADLGWLDDESSSIQWS